MTKHFRTVFIAAVLSIIPAAGFAMTQTTQAPAKHSTTHATATHATRGVVKSMEGSTLVITRSGGNHEEMTFEMNASTHREGAIAAGAPVSVRYREDGKTNVATAVRVESAKQQPATKK
jgi:hypothetical protein